MRNQWALHTFPVRTSRLSWAFLIHLSLSFAHGLEDIATRQLKQWSELYRSAHVTLYRRLTKNSLHYTCKSLNLGCFSLPRPTNSRYLHVSAVVENNLRFAGQTDRAGL